MPLYQRRREGVEQIHQQTDIEMLGAACGRCWFGDCYWRDGRGPPRCRGPSNSERTLRKAEVASERARQSLRSSNDSFVSFAAERNPVSPGALVYIASWHRPSSVNVLVQL